VVYPPTGSTAYVKEMSTAPTLLLGYGTLLPLYSFRIQINRYMNARLMLVMQEYISTTLPMMVNTLMQMISIVMRRLIGDDADDATQLQKVTLVKFTVRTSDEFSVVIIKQIVKTGQFKHFSKGNRQ